jgi:hypothetical protein
MYRLNLSLDEMEYLQMALHCWIERNAKNSQEYQVLEGPDMEVNLVDTLWAPQNVEAQRLLDKTIAIVGHDLAVEGQ